MFFCIYEPEIVCEKDPNRKPSSGSQSPDFSVKPTYRATDRPIDRPSHWEKSFDLNTVVTTSSSLAVNSSFGGIFNDVTSVTTSSSPAASPACHNHWQLDDRACQQPAKHQYDPRHQQRFQQRGHRLPGQSDKITPHAL